MKVFDREFWLVHPFMAGNSSYEIHLIWPGFNFSKLDGSCAWELVNDFNLHHLYLGISLSTRSRRICLCTYASLTVFLCDHKLNIFG